MSSFQSSFSSTCSIPSTPAHFVSSPDSRGTLDILWNSLSALGLCSWSVLHLAVPKQSEARSRGGEMRKTMMMLKHKFLWMIATLIAPEILVGKALVDWVSARHSKTRMGEFAEKEGLEWTMTHGFYANIGGFLLYFDRNSRSKPSNGGNEIEIVSAKGAKDLNEQNHSGDQTTEDPISSKKKVPSDRDNKIEVVSTKGAKDPNEQKRSTGQTTINPTSSERKVPSNRDNEIEDVSAQGAKDPNEQNHSTGQTAENPISSEKKASSTAITTRSSVDESSEFHASSRSLPIQPKTFEAKSRNLSSGNNDCAIRLSGRYCPCTNLKSSAKYEYMSFSDIIAHSLPFWNGKFRVFPLVMSLGKRYSNDAEKSSEETTNQEIAGQALYQFARKPGTSPEDFSIRAASLAYLQGREWILDAEQLRTARELGIIESLPSVTIEELNDQGKGDHIVKLSAIASILYLVVQLIVRRIQKVSSSQLEIAVLAFSGPASFIYTLFLSKPQDVQVPRRVHVNRYPTPDDLNTLAQAGPFRNHIGGRGKWLFIDMPNLNLHNCGSSDSFDDRGQTWSVKVLSFGAVIGGTMFGAVHCIAWNFEFPTPAERLLWRMASVFNTAFPIVALLLTSGNELGHILVWKLLGQDAPATGWRFRGFSDHTDNKKIIVGQLISFLSVLYVLARVFTFVEVFRTLFFLPPDVFRDTDWSAVFPHIG